MGFIFIGGNFREEDNIAKKHEKYPHVKISTFTVYDMIFHANILHLHFSHHNPIMNLNFFY